VSDTAREPHSFKKMIVCRRTKNLRCGYLYSLPLQHKQTTTTAKKKTHNVSRFQTRSQVKGRVATVTTSRAATSSDKSLDKFATQRFERRNRRKRPFPEVSLDDCNLTTANYIGELTLHGVSTSRRSLVEASSIFLSLSSNPFLHPSVIHTPFTTQ
jgi:hypothetical protein